MRGGERRIGAGAASSGSMLFGGLLDGVDENRMLVIPDGPLNGVPFAALPCRRRSTDLLIDRFVLGYAPSLALAMTAPPAAPRNTRVAVISDPVYAPDDRRLRSPGRERRQLCAARRSLAQQAHPAALFGARGERGARRHSEQQARSSSSGIRCHAGARLAARVERTRGAAFRDPCGGAPDSPEQSALYLSEYTRTACCSRTAASRPTTSRAAGLRADVVVLSGCATGDGSALRGEGVLGLTYGFLANGSRSVVASLWPIEDASTARFMNEFYGAYRARAVPPKRCAPRSCARAATPRRAVWSSFVVRANGFP